MPSVGEAARLQAAARYEAESTATLRAAQEKHRAARHARLAVLADLRKAGWTWDALARFVARERQGGAAPSPAERRRLAAALRQDLARWRRVTAGHAIPGACPGVDEGHDTLSRQEEHPMKIKPRDEEWLLPIRKTVTTTVEEFAREDFGDDVAETDDEDDETQAKPRRRK